MDRGRGQARTAGRPGEATIGLAQSFFALDFESARAESEAALEAARRIDPRSAQALRMTGKSAYVPNDDLIIRALALGSLGRTDAAISEFTRATEQSYRTLIDFEYFLRPEDYPFMREVAEDRRYRALVAAIEADNLRMRENLLASRAAGRRGRE
jgi:hypothetical protein